MRKHIALLAYDEAVPSAVVGALDVFRKTNEFLASRDAPPPHPERPAARLLPPGLDVSLVSPDGRNPRMGMVEVGPCAAPEEVQHVDLVVVPAIDQDIPQFLTRHLALARWIRDQHEAGAEVASVCTGAFLVAASGILDGRSASTHWAAAADFARAFPRVQLQPENLITDEDGIYTSGGATSFHNLLLYVIEKHFGREVTLWLAHMLLVDLDRTSQTYFAAFAPQKRHGDRQILEVQRYIEAHYREDLSVTDLHERFGIRRRTFIRRFKVATGVSPLQYIQRVKIEAAKKALETTPDTILEVMYEVGYNDLKYFRRLFRQMTGLTPAAYRRKYASRWRGSSAARRVLTA